MRRAGWAVLLAALMLARTAMAHEGVHASGVSPTAFWNGVTAAVLTSLLFLYCRGVERLWKSEGGRQAVRGWQVAAFVSGVFCTAVALLSPLDRWSDVFFSAHMAQHEILMLLSAPLMVLGRPFIATMWALRPSTRASVASSIRRPAVTAFWETVSGPLTVLLLHAVVLWVWHVPAMFEIALHHEPIHVVQHLGFFLTAALFWWALIHGRYGRLGYGVGVIYVFATAMHTEILGALLTFGTRTWYPTHALRTAASGRNPLEDQQLAGVVMWIPFGVMFVLIGLALFAAWMGEAERRVAFTSSERIIHEVHS